MEGRNPGSYKYSGHANCHNSSDFTCQISKFLQRKKAEAVRGGFWIDRPTGDGSDFRSWALDELLTGRPTRRMVRDKMHWYCCLDKGNLALALIILSHLSAIVIISSHSNSFGWLSLSFSHTYRVFLCSVWYHYGEGDEVWFQPIFLD